MIITTTFLQQRFNEFNERYFNNKITPVCFSFGKSKRHLGIYYPYSHRIEITTYYKNITEFDVEKILIHEMCHAWQYCTNHRDSGKNWSHGYWFHWIANRVNSMSDNKYNIHRLTKLSPESLEGVKQRATSNIIILSCKKSSEPKTYYVGRVTENAIGRLEYWLGGYYDEIKAYRIKEESASNFNWKTSKTHFNYHKIPADKYNELVFQHISGTLKFEDKYPRKKIAACNAE